MQPAAQRWFRQPVVEIKQISAYSCRGMNGNPNAHISEHAFGNALDVAEFDLADGHKVSVQYGWKGSPEEQGFLHDVQLAACNDFTTVLAPGANVYHYNHIHVDLMRHYDGRHICEPSAIPGEVAAVRARSQFAARHPGEHYGDRRHRFDQDQSFGPPARLFGRGRRSLARGRAGRRLVSPSLRVWGRSTGGLQRPFSFYLKNTDTKQCGMIRTYCAMRLGYAPDGLSVRAKSEDWGRVSRDAPLPRLQIQEPRFIRLRRR